MSTGLNMSATSKSLSPLVVRDGTSDDIERVSPMWTDLYDHEEAHGMMLKLSEGAVTTWARQMCSRLDASTTLFLVAEHEGVISGFFTAQIKMLPPMYRDGLVASMQELYVEPQYRGRGIARALVAEAVERFKEQGVTSIEGQIVRGDSTSLQFWKSLGWELELVQIRKKLT